MLNNIISRIKLPFRKEKELYSCLYNITGFYPKHIDYYKLALQHKSVSQGRNGGRLVNNERLEFLGDAIIGAVVGDIVYQRFPGKREGFLTNTRSKIVARGTLNKLAAETGLTSLVHSSNSTQISHNSYVGGNAFEAIVGALYLDRGYNACKVFVNKRILGNIINLDKIAYKEVNFKSKLLEWCQKNRVKIEFKLLSETTDSYGSPMFCFQVLLEGVEGSTGTGFSKKESQQNAARQTLTLLRRNPQFIDSVFQAKSNRIIIDDESVENPE